MYTHARRGRGALRGRGGGARRVGSRSRRLDVASRRRRARERSVAGDDPLRRSRPRPRRHGRGREQRQTVGRRREAPNPRQQGRDSAPKAPRRRLHRPLAGALGRRAHRRRRVRVRSRCGPIAATGLVRAFSELTAVSQLWSSGYGRAIVIKSGFLAAVVALGWINRSRLVPRLRLTALRRNVTVELVLLAAIVTAVAFLTDLAPGRQLARAVARPETPQPIAAPPKAATVLAGESGDRA